MKALVLVVLSSSILSGCSLFGYYKHEKAMRAPPEEAAQVTFPDSFEGGIHLAGPMAAAIEIAMNDFLPPGARRHVTDNYKPLEDCLSRRSTYDVSILKASDDLFFVSFNPLLQRCNLDEELLDGGAVYAVDGKGRILDVH